MFRDFTGTRVSIEQPQCGSNVLLKIRQYLKLYTVIGNGFFFHRAGLYDDQPWCSSFMQFYLCCGHFVCPSIAYLIDCSPHRIGLKTRIMFGILPPNFFGSIEHGGAVLMYLQG